MSKRPTKKAGKKAPKYQRGDKVWVKGTLDISDNGSFWVNVKCHHAIRDEGECDLKVPKSSLRPAVELFEWSPKKPTPKGAKKK